MSNIIYSNYIFDDYLISPKNGEKCKRINSQNIKRLGFETREEFFAAYPGFPKVCKNSMEKINPKRANNAYIAQSLSIQIDNIQIYNLNPNVCQYCRIILPYEKKGHTYCSHKCSGYAQPKRIISTDERSKMSIRAKNNPTGVSSPDYILARKLKPSPALPINTCQHLPCNQTFKTKNKNQKYCSAQCRSHYKGGYRSQSQLKVKKSIFCGYHLDSGAELYFAKLLNKNGIVWIKNDINWKKKFSYKKSHGRFYYYYPDFYLPQYNCWVEIKGKRYVREDDKDRYSIIPIPHHLVFSDEIKEFVEKLSK